MNDQLRGRPDTSAYWSCLVEPGQEAGELADLINMPNMHSLELKTGLKNAYLNWKMDDGAEMIILGPPRVAGNIDYAATSFGVSTQCRAILNNTCDISVPSDVLYQGVPVQDFNCTKEKSGVDAAGRIVPDDGLVYYMDFHRFWTEPPPFVTQPGNITSESLAAAEKLTIEEEDTVFKNPWNWLAAADVTSTQLTIQEADTEPFLWMQRWGPENEYRLARLMLHCNTSSKSQVNFRNSWAKRLTENLVWDIKYRVVDGKVDVTDRVLSNSTVTGMSSMSTSPYLGLTARWWVSLAHEAKLMGIDTPTHVGNWSRIASQKLIAPFAGASINQPATHAQTRALRVVTKVPKVAVWILIAANMLFTLLAFVTAVVALKSTSTDVHQVHTRLSISGLAAQLFEQKQAQHKVIRPAQLFEKHAEETPGRSQTVRIQRTENGGTMFSF
jgi:hypothetical protein